MNIQLNNRVNRLKNIKYSEILTKHIYILSNLTWLDLILDFAINLQIFIGQKSYTYLRKTFTQSLKLTATQTQRVNQNVGSQNKRTNWPISDQSL